MFRESVEPAMKGFWRSRWFILTIVIVILIPSLLILILRLDFGQREDAVLKYFSEQERMPEVFAQLEQLTPSNSVVLCWWDYGRAVRQWSHRQVVEAYPSRDIWYSMGSSRDPWHNLETQIFGTWGSSEKIHDMATMFIIPEDQSLQMMRHYSVSHVLVFTPDDLQKFYWIAHIAGHNGTEYLTMKDNTYQPTGLGSQTTLLRLLFDDTLHPGHFTKLYDNSKGKIYRVNY
jgi:hypothetical protein